MDTDQLLGHRAAAGPKACATCRLAHVSCDRGQPCGRCVRVGKAESCRPPPTRKRGRPRKTSTSPRPIPQAQAAASKRVCVRPKTVVDRPANRQPPPAAGPTCASSSPSSSWSSSLSPLQAEEDCASPWSSPSSSPSSPPSQPTGFAQARAAGQPDQREQDGQGTQSLLMLVVDQVREMRRENERLRDTIAQMRATQSETERRLARVEADNENKSRQLEQTRIELEQTRAELNKKIDDHVMAAHPCPPPTGDAHSQSTAQSGACTGLLAAAMEPRTAGAEVEWFIAQMLPFLRAFDCSSLIIRDLRRPFVIMRMEEAETLDDVDTPIIAYVSPSMCNLLGYDQRELHGCPITSFGVPDPESLSMCVWTRLLRSPTPVGEPFYLPCTFVTKQGRGVRVLAGQQSLHSQRGLADWHITQVETVLATDLGLVPLIKPTFCVGHNDPRQRDRSVVHEPSLRAHLVARLPHSLLFGRRHELAIIPQPRPHHSFEGNHHQDHHRRSATAEQQQRPPTPPLGLEVATCELREERKLAELVRALGLPLDREESRSPLFGQWMTFADAPPAERWLH